LRKAFESRRELVDWVGVESSSAVKFSIDGILRNFFNHHSQTIQDLISIHLDCKVTWVEDFRVLIFETADSEGFAFNLSRQPIDACL
jgi:hypothetical protein